MARPALAGFVVLLRHLYMQSFEQSWLQPRRPTPKIEVKRVLSPVERMTKDFLKKYRNDDPETEAKLHAIIEDICAATLNPEEFLTELIITRARGPIYTALQKNPDMDPATAYALISDRTHEVIQRFENAA